MKSWLPISKLGDPYKFGEQCSTPAAALFWPNLCLRWLVVAEVGIPGWQLWGQRVFLQHLVSTPSAPCPLIHPRHLPQPLS